MAKVSVSILGSDFGNLNEEIEKYNSAGVDMIHLDVFDGNFVPTVTFGSSVIKGIRKRFPKLFLDCHLCVEYPDKWVEELKPYNLDLICVHYESFSSFEERVRTLKKIRQNGSGAGLVFNPDTPIHYIDEYVKYIDYALIMCVKPGYGGLKLDPRNLLKVQYLKHKYPSLCVGVDGGVKTFNSDLCIESGADIVVAGSAITGAKEEDYGRIVQELKTNNRKRDITDWNGLPAKHTPQFVMEEDIKQELKKNSGMVSYEEVLNLKEELKKVEMGNKFILSVGDCSEDIDNYDIQKYIKELNEMFLDCEKSLNKQNIDVLPIFRACGQIIKPRTKPHEADGTNSFWGLNMNTMEDRSLDQGRLVKGADFSKRAYEELRKLNKDAYIAHETLLCSLEHCMTKKTESGRYYNSSTHMIWLGNKTKQMDHQQVHYLKNMDNPIGVKVGVKDLEDPSNMLELLKLLNPYNESGKIVLISRIGKGLKVEDLKSFYDCLNGEKLKFSWCIDPCHGNTETYQDGKKVRYIQNVQIEIIETQLVFNVNGLMFEATADPTIQECLYKDEDIKVRNFESLCDPRINKDQLLYLLENTQIKTNQNVCLILAKKGSTGFPGKNKMKFLTDEHPFYLQTIFEAYKSGSFDRIFITTNDEEIIDMCSKYENMVTAIRRSDEYAQNTHYVQSVKHAIEYIKGVCNPATITIPMVVQPFKEEGIYGKMLRILKEQSCDSVVTLGDGPGCREWLLRSFEEHEEEVYSVKPFVFSSSQGRKKNIFEIDNSITCFRVDNMAGSLPWDYLGTNIVGLKQKFINSNYNCDINYEDDYVWGEFIKTYRNWRKTYQKELIKEFETGLFSDLLDQWGLRNQVITGFKYNNPKLKYLGKVRTTVLKDREEIENYTGENIKLGLGFFETLNHDEVLVVKGSYKYAYFGQLMSTLGMRQQIEGVVIDGLTRDTGFTAGLEELGIHAKGYSPKDIKERGAVVSTDVPVEIDGVKICPGDYIFGDNDGIVVIPKKIYENQEFQGEVRKCLKEEEHIKKFIHGNSTVKEILSQFKSF